MTFRIIQYFLTCFLFSTILSFAPAWSASAPQNTLTGACIKLEHIDNNMDGAHMSGAVTVEVLNDTQASINQNRGYITRINPNTIQILFTRQNNWEDGELFSGLVIDDIMWSGDPERILAKVNVKTKIPYFSKKRITMQTNSILVDFRGLSVKNGDSILISLEMGTK